MPMSLLRSLKILTNPVSTNISLLRSFEISKTLRSYASRLQSRQRLGLRQPSGAFGRAGRTRSLPKTAGMLKINLSSSSSSSSSNFPAFGYEDENQDNLLATMPLCSAIPKNRTGWRRFLVRLQNLAFSILHLPSSILFILRREPRCVFALNPPSYSCFQNGHRTTRPGSTSTNSGTFSEHSGRASGQRGANRQPGGNSPGCGT